MLLVLMFFVLHATTIAMEEEKEIEWGSLDKKSVMKICFNIVLLCLFGSVQGAFDAELYSKSNVGQFKHAIKELYKLNLSGSEKILDVGSGDGYTSSYIAKEYLSNGCLVGIDNSIEMIAFAGAHSSGSNVSYIQADIREYKKLEEYDAIVSFWTLHWIVEYAQALENVAASLKKGGKTLICHIIGSNPIQPIVDQLLELPEWKFYRANSIKLFNAPSLVKVADAIEHSGLNIESLEVKKNGEWMPMNLFKQNLLSLPLFDFIPANVRGQFLDEVLKIYIQRYPLNEKNEVLYWLPVIAMVLKK